MDYKKKTAVITGGLGGAGLATSKMLENEGWNVVLIDLPEVLKVAVGGDSFFKKDSVVTLPADLRDNKQIEAVFAKAAERFGGIDALINCVASTENSDLNSLEGEVIDAIFDVNAKAIMLCCKAAIKYLKKADNSAILNFGDISSRMASGENLILSATKAAVTAFTRELAVDVWESGIRCNTLSTGTFISSANVDKNSDPVWIEAQKKRVLADRIMTPDDVAEVACFLVSEDSFCINATEVRLDGGGLFFRDKPESSGYKGGKS